MVKNELILYYTSSRGVRTGARNRCPFGDASAQVSGSPRLSRCEGNRLPGAAATRLPQGRSREQTHCALFRKCRSQPSAPLPAPALRVPGPGRIPASGAPAPRCAESLLRRTRAHLAAVCVWSEDTLATFVHSNARSINKYFRTRVRPTRISAVNREALH